MSLIYRTLKKKCDEKPELMPLRAQWEFDIRLLSDALRSVAISFPHYSLHDESHSNTIVIQIEKVLGEERIEKLSATNLWFILEAAYSHDLGMVISEEEKRKTIQSSEFQGYLNEILENKNHEFYNEAEIVIPIHNQYITTFKNMQWPLDVSRAITILIADFYRRQHATMSFQSITDPERIGLKSPRTGLIPNRLFKILGKISKSHGENQDFVLRLPFDEDGLGSEKCHPRFIAFLLRLGDLLDIDNGRFCSVMLSTFGKLPESSKHHVDKHDAIDHLSISKEKIEIYATAKNYEDYSLLVDWLDYIRKEINFINTNLNQFVPDFTFGFFPSARDLVVHLKDFELISNSERPKIEIDQNIAISLLQGNNLYSSNYAFLRELIQNSVDATFLRISMDMSKEIHEQTPQNFFNNLIEEQRYKINISVEQRDSANGKKLLLFKIEDRGIGISKEEINSLLKVGTSKKNLRKQKLIKQVPDWLHPSGYFGLGFQSVFSITDKVEITTKSIFENCIYSIKFIEKGKKAIITKTEIEEFEITSSYTKLEIEIEESKIPSSFNFDLDNKEAKSIISNFDPLKNEELPIELVNLRHEIQKYCSVYPLWIELNGIQIGRRKFDNRKIFFDKEHNVELEVSPSLNEYSRSEILYRDQYIKKNNSSINYRNVNFKINIRQSTADAFLTFSRDEISNAGYEKLENILNECIPKALFSRYNILKESSSPNEAEDIKLISLCALLLELEKSSYPFGQEWKEISLQKFSGSKKIDGTLSTLYNAESLSATFESHANTGNTTLKIEGQSIGSFEFENNSGNYPISFFRKFFFDSFNYHYVEKRDKKMSEDLALKVPIIHSVTFKFSKSKIAQIMISKDILKNYFDDYKILSERSIPVMKRFLLPLFDEKYFPLSCSFQRFNEHLPFVKRIDDEFKYWKLFLISPFILDGQYWVESGKEEAIRKILILNNGRNSKEEIERLYLDLIKELRELLPKAP